MRIYGVLALAFLAACSYDPPGVMAGDGTGGVGSGGGDPGMSGMQGGGGGGATPDAGGGMTQTGFGTIFTILLENHSADSIVGSTNAPYINSLINEYGLAQNYQDSGSHPSLPNYLYMISGDTQYFGLVDVDPTTIPFPVDKDNLGNQLSAKGIAWRSYQESAGGSCVLAGNNQHYAPKHNPFLYFTKMQKDSALCSQTSVDYSQFAADLAGGTYKYMFITPNLLNDGHDPTNDPIAGLKQSDAWLATELPKILSSAAYLNGGVVFLTWDEGEASGLSTGDHIPMIVISTKLKSKGYKSSQPYTHASYLATIEDIFGLTRLGAADKATPLFEFFQ